MARSFARITSSLGTIAVAIISASVLLMSCSQKSVSPQAQDVRAICQEELESLGIPQSKLVVSVLPELYTLDSLEAHSFYLSMPDTSLLEGIRSRTRGKRFYHCTAVLEGGVFGRKCYLYVDSSSGRILDIVDIDMMIPQRWSPSDS